VGKVELQSRISGIVQMSDQMSTERGFIANLDRQLDQGYRLLWYSVIGVVSSALWFIVFMLLSGKVAWPFVHQTLTILAWCGLVSLFVCGGIIFSVRKVDPNALSRVLESYEPSAICVLLEFHDILTRSNATGGKNKHDLSKIRDRIVYLCRMVDEHTNIKLSRRRQREFVDVLQYLRDYDQPVLLAAMALIGTRETFARLDQVVWKLSLGVRKDDAAWMHLKEMVSECKAAIMSRTDKTRLF